MINKLRTIALENKFPILSIENGCIISKNADITVCFKVELPELFTISAGEYQEIHSTWVKAAKVLPDFTILHKQDWFMKEKYVADIDRDNLNLLARSYELHFNERAFLNHACYLFLTKTTKQQSLQQSNFNTLCRGYLIPKEVNRETTGKYLECTEQFQQILNDSGYIRLIRLTDTEITGTKEKPGIIQKYLNLSLSDNDNTLQDIAISAGEMKIGDNYVCLHTLSDLDTLPDKVATDSTFKKYSTAQTDCKLSFAAPIGLLLNCDHIYNQYLIIDNSVENLQKFEKTAKNMLSLSRYSRANQINREWITLYLNEAHSKSLTSVRCHANVMAWSSDPEELKRIKTEVGSQLATMDCTPRHNCTDVPALFWSAIPGNSSDLPSEETFYTFIEPALCFFTQETNYRSSPSTFGIKLSDRVSGKPILVDISDLPMRKGIITNRNKFVVGPSGSGKSFFTNHFARQYYFQGSHELIVDTGNSYWGLCHLINTLTNGQDGIYYTYTNEEPICFNPFFVEDGVFDIEKRESIKTLLLTLWKRDSGLPTPAEEVVLSNAVNQFLKKIKTVKIEPIFDTFYEFVDGEYRESLSEKMKTYFDIDNFLGVLEPFYRDGEYGYLLNSRKQLDLINKRFIVFELDNIQNNKVLFPVVTLIIMETFISKMRKLKGIRKVIIIEEAWKALTKQGMSEYIKYLYKTVRKHFGEAVTVTQDVSDIISSDVVKEAIINNADCKILLDQRKYLNKFSDIQTLLGLTDKQKAEILSINQSNAANRNNYKEVWIGCGSQSAVYGTEVSTEEYLTFTTEETEKQELLSLAEKLGGNLPLAIKQLAEIKRHSA